MSFLFYVEYHKHVMNLNLSMFPHIHKASDILLGTDFSRGMSKVKEAEKHFLTTDFTYQTAEPGKGLWHPKSFNVFMAVIKITLGVAAATALKAIEFQCGEDSSKINQTLFHWCQRK